MTCFEGFLGFSSCSKWRALKGFWGFWDRAKWRALEGSKGWRDFLKWHASKGFFKYPLNGFWFPYQISNPVSMVQKTLAELHQRFLPGGGRSKTHLWNICSSNFMWYHDPSKVWFALHCGISAISCRNSCGTKSLRTTFKGWSHSKNCLKTSANKDSSATVNGCSLNVS